MGLLGWKPSTTDPSIASVRLRCLNPLAELRRRGYPIELFDSSHANDYAAVVYSKAYRSEDCLEASRLKEAGARIAFDLCDNHLYNPSGLPYWRDAGERLRRMLTLADAVSVSTHALANVLTHEVPGLRRPTVIGDAVETQIAHSPSSRWSQWVHVRQLRSLATGIEREIKHGRTPLVWFGNHGSPYAEGGMMDLLRIRAEFEATDRQYPVSLSVISNSRRKFMKTIWPWSVPTHYLPWHPATFLAALRLHAIAVIPTLDNPFTRCKSNNRLALALAVGLAVVADSVPSYEPFRDVTRLGDWTGGLTTYLSSPETRDRDVQAGKELVFRDWSLATISEKWARFFDGLFGRSDEGGMSNFDAPE